MDRKNAWTTYSKEELDRLEQVNTEYKNCLDAGKTERECVTLAVEKAKAEGYKDIRDIIKNGGEVKAGDKLYAVCMNKTIALFHMGTKPLTEGMNILGAHIDSPRIDVKQNPLYENEEFAYLDTHYYGGIKKYQWVTLPLALHGVIAKKDGTTVQVSIGEKEDDPVFVITDLLIHLASKQMEKKAATVVEGEKLDLLIGSRPIEQDETLEEKEKEAGITIFLRSRTGITLTKDGAEFLGYARQVIQQMELLEDRYVTNLPGKVTFGVSSQHYTFTENAFVELVKRFGQERYAFYYNETGTHQILDDVKNRVCDLGILYLSHENEVVMRKVIEENHLVFTELFSAKPHVFLQKDHPLASKKVVSVHDLAPYPRLNFVQGEYESVYFSEELFSSIPVDKEIRVNDRGAIVNFMLGLNAYTISSGIFPKYLNGENIISVPLAENETMHIGYVLNENQELSELGKSYLEELRKYAPANP